MHQQELQDLQQKTILTLTDAMFPQLSDVQQSNRDPAAFACQLLNQAKALEMNLKLLANQTSDYDGDIAESWALMVDVCTGLAAGIDKISKENIDA